MNNFFKWLFSVPDDPKKPRPILIVVLVVVVIVFGIYQINKNKGNNEQTQQTQQPTTEVTEKVSIINKIKSAIPFLNKNENILEENTNKEINLPPLPSVPTNIGQNDDSLFQTVESMIQERFNMKSIVTNNMGRRDPMKPIKGDNVGTYEESRIDDNAYDLLNESKNYFGGMAVDDIILDNVTYNAEGLPTADFITLGGVVIDLKEGDLICELYTIKQLNFKEEFALIEYNGTQYKMKAQNILSSNTMKTPIPAQTPTDNENNTNNTIPSTPK